jgi:sec-independent protein translocase protein TatA
VIGDILQPTHLLFVLVIALLVLGPKRLPEVGRSLGKGLRDFRHAMSGEHHDDETLTQTTAEEPLRPAVETVDPVVVPVEPVEPATQTVKPAEPVGWATSRRS